MDVEIKFIHRKHGKVLLYKAHQYVKQKIYANKSSIWNCTQKQKLKCKGSVTINEDGHYIKSIPHQIECVPDGSQNEVAMATHKVKIEAAATSETVTKIYKKYIEPLKDKGLAILSKVPSFNNTKHAIYNSRNKGYQVRKTVYNNLSEVEVPIKFIRYLIADYYDTDTRILVIASEEKLKLMRDVDEIFVDGTFKAVPSPFYQLMAIHGEIGSTSVTTKVVPLMYVLLPNKTEKTYTVMFDMITVAIPDFKPKIVHVDYEFAITNALKKIFPNITIDRCYYHYTQSLWKKAKNLKMKSKVIRRIVGLCCVLPLLPTNMIIEGWSYITQECKDVPDKKVKTFVNYFENFYLKENFIKEWCVYNRRHRTNNASETWNSSINKKINKNYVTVANLLTNIFFKPHSTLSDRRKLNYILRDTQILNAQRQLLNNEISVGHFLDKLR